MSAETAAWALRQNPGNPGAKLLLVVLVDYSTETGEVSPTQKSLAERTNQSERTVRGHLASLEEAGYITRIRQTRDDGMRSSDRYQLNLSAESAGTTKWYQMDTPERLPADSAGQKLMLKANAKANDYQLNPSGLTGDTPVEPKKRRGKSKSQETDDEDPSVALGIWATREDIPTKSDCIPRKAPGPDTPLGLAAAWAMTVAREAKGWGAVQLGQGNQRALAKHFKGWINEGVSPDEIRAMSTLYAESYLGQAGSKLPWIDFLAKRKLLLDKVRPSEDAWATDHDHPAERIAPNYDESDFCTRD